MSRPRQRPGPPPLRPLPRRDGVDAARLLVRPDAAGLTVGAYLTGRFPDHAAALGVAIAAGEVVAEVGGVARPVRTDDVLVAGSHLHLHRPLPAEAPVPGEVEVLHRDDDLLVVDKPHFLATTPRGSHVAETVLVRLRRTLDLPDLAPAHRLDRLTAGVLLLTVRREVRGAYQGLFERREVTKTYKGVAAHDPSLRLPVTVRSRLVKERGVLAARTVEGPPNAETHVSLSHHADGLAAYDLVPRTGRTHQLRVHMASLGVPLLGDDLYPVVAPLAPDWPADHADPLQLLARELRFVDPLSGEPRVFRSRRTLARAPGSRGPLHSRG